MSVILSRSEESVSVV